MLWRVAPFCLVNGFSTTASSPMSSPDVLHRDEIPPFSGGTVTHIVPSAPGGFAPKAHPPLAETSLFGMGRSVILSTELKFELNI